MADTATYAPALFSGQTIGVMAPSGYVERDSIEAAAQLLRNRGYTVFIHPQTFEREGQMAGTVLQKSMALQGLWHRKDIDVIWFAGGGNGAMDLISSLNFDTLSRTQKTIIGFSDTTILLNVLAARVNAHAVHAPVLKTLQKLSTPHFSACIDALEGKHRILSFSDDDILRSGDASGVLVGGNLSLVQYLPALLSDDYLSGALLFLEDCHEELSRIDRMFSFLKAAGVLSRINGLILGQFSDLSNSGRSFERNFDEIVISHTDSLNIPVIKNMPFGHDYDYGFVPFTIGAKAKIDFRNFKISW